ncbi:MAG: PhoH family protein [Planctomycetota bacterium]
MSDVTIPLRNIDEERTLLGHLDRNLRILRQSFGIDATSRAGQLTLNGDPGRIEAAAGMVRRALDLIRDNGVNSTDVAELFEVDAPNHRSPESGRGERIKFAASPRSPNQQRYMETVLETPVTFALGPAGTGKTYLAVAMAVTLMKTEEYHRIILVRPAVEAGEHLGFLPGDLEAKITPYLRPLYDSLQSLVPKGLLKRYMDEGGIEISPLAYMRGRTLNHSIIILDEAQNTTMAQMKMFLTRMGDRSKIIVTGDPSQVDLPGNQTSGLLHASRVLKQVEGVAFCYLNRKDIVRHEVVQRIVHAYGSWEERLKQEKDGAPKRSQPPGKDADRKNRR